MLKTKVFEREGEGRESDQRARGGVEVLVGGYGCMPATDFARVASVFVVVRPLMKKKKTEEKMKKKKKKKKKKKTKTKKKKKKKKK